MHAIPESPLIRGVSFSSLNSSSHLDQSKARSCCRRICPSLCFEESTTTGRHFRARDHCICFIPSILRDFDFFLLLNVLLAEVATWLCCRYGFDMNPTMLGSMIVVPTVMPLAFSISQSHSRRERALAAVGTLQSSLWTLHAVHSEWAPRSQPSGSAGAATNDGLGSSTAAAAPHMLLPPLEVLVAGESFVGEASLFKVILGLLRSIRLFATQTRHRGRNRALERVYESFRRVRQQNRALAEAVGKAGTDKTRAGGFPAAALIGNTSAALNAFEQIRVVRDYPTPTSARVFHKLMSTLLPVLLAPAFARAAVLSGEGAEWSSYYLAAVVSLTFGMLNSVQDALDNPFNSCSQMEVSVTSC